LLIISSPFIFKIDFGCNQSKLLIYYLCRKENLCAWLACNNAAFSILALYMKQEIVMNITNNICHWTQTRYIKLPDYWPTFPKSPLCPATSDVDQKDAEEIIFAAKHNLNKEACPVIFSSNFIEHKNNRAMSEIEDMR
jgi:hypothetical protein